MRYFLEDFGIPLLLIVLLFVCLIGGAYTYERSVCFSKTVDMGFESRFSFMGGCQIEVREGQWIPLDSYYFKEE